MATPVKLSQSSAMATPVKRQSHRPPPSPSTPRRVSQNTDPNLSTPRRNPPSIKPPKTPNTTKKTPQPSSTKPNGSDAPQPSRGDCKEGASTVILDSNNSPPPSRPHPKSLPMDRTPTPRKPNQSGQTKFLDSNNSPKPSKGVHRESGKTMFLDSKNSPKPSNEGECGESGKTKFLDFKNSPQGSRPRTPRKVGEKSPCSGSSSGSMSYKVRKMKRVMLEEARSSIPETGVGRVMHLVHAFERLLTLPKGSQVNQGREVMHLVLPESEGSENAVEIQGSAYSIDGSDDRLSLGSSFSEGGGRRSSRGDSSESSESGWSRKLKVTCQQPFKLRTEQRGRKKEERFLNKMKEMLQEEKKYRVPIAQSLPLTTDHPECPAKPKVKESTEPIDVVLHSDVRALERAEFDQQNAQRLTFYEQTKLERELQQKLEEEEETRRLRRELVHKAQPMPHFDRPFVPKKSTRPQTAPKEPRFHSRQ